MSKIRETIADKNIKLIAVSKGQSLAAIEEAYGCGVRDFGENYLQEALPKIHHFCHSRVGGNPAWHFLGRIQSKKIKELATHFACIHSLDSLDHARKFDLVGQNLGKTIDVFVQVNLDNEPQKGGVATSDLLNFMQTLQALPNIKVLGLMLIPKIADPATSLAKFQQLKKLLATIPGTAGCLSMGMSHDYALAIAAGSTHIRVGEALFGKRQK